MGGWGPRNPFAERIEKPIRKIGPPLIAIVMIMELLHACYFQDDSISQMKSLGNALKEMEEDRNRTEARHLQLQKTLVEAEEDKKGIDGRLASAQTALMLQEETIRRNERERKSMSDKIQALERNLVAAEADKRQLNVSL